MKKLSSSIRKYAYQLLQSEDDYEQRKPGMSFAKRALLTTGLAAGTALAVTAGQKNSPLISNQTKAEIRKAVSGASPQVRNKLRRGVRKVRGAVVRTRNRVRAQQRVDLRNLTGG